MTRVIECPVSLLAEHPIDVNGKIRLVMYNFYFSLWRNRNVKTERGLRG
jgi:hypothetical protein